jgi:site-specific recombinase XerD
MELTLQRRHSPDCPDREKGPHYLKCRGKCKIRAVGYDDLGKRIRKSLHTRDLARAWKILATREEVLRAGSKPRKLLADAVASFGHQHEDKAPETRRKYTRVVNALAEYLSGAGIEYVDQVTLELLDGYAHARRKNNWTYLKELELWRQFFGFCLKRKWCEDNPAEDIKRPKPMETEVVPFTQSEIIRTMSACDQFGAGPYERLRARAMVLVFRYTGMRISDVVTLSKEHLQGGRIVKRAIKNKKMIRVDLPAAVIEALNALPHPKGAAKDSKLFFGSGTASIRSLVKGAERTLSSVFKRAGVEGAYPHRFRHTLASELLGKGESIEMVSAILADTPAIVSRHYAKWTPEFQIRQDQAIRKIHDTNLAQAEETVKPC